MLLSNLFLIIKFLVWKIIPMLSTGLVYHWSIECVEWKIILRAPNYSLKSMSSAFPALRIKQAYLTPNYLQFNEMGQPRYFTIIDPIGPYHRKQTNISFQILYSARCVAYSEIITTIFSIINLYLFFIIS